MPALYDNDITVT